MRSAFISGVTMIAPRMPVVMTSTAVSGGRPPSFSDTAMATPAVTDLGASETSTTFGAPSQRAIRTADAMAVIDPASSAAAIGSRRAPDQLEIAEQRNAKRHGRGPKQEMHELRAVEIGRIVRPAEA